VRFGLAKRTELRFTVPDYFHNLTTSDGVGSGLGDVAMGVKQQLGPAQGFDVSVICSSACRPAATIRDCRCRGLAVCPPTGRRQECSRRIGPLRPARRNVTGEFMFLLDRQLMKPWDAFVEYAGDFPEICRPRHLPHFGTDLTDLKITKQQQIDFHIGVGCGGSPRRDRLFVPLSEDPWLGFRVTLVSLRTYRRSTRMFQARREGT